MSQLTVVSVGEKTLGVVSARSTPGGVEIVRAATAPLPEAKTPEALRDALARCGGPNGRTALLVPRATAILRDFDLPSGTPEEVLQMLRFQVEKELPLPIEQVRYSFIEAPGAEGKLRISVAAVPSDHIEALLGALEKAGCKVQGAYVSSFGLASLLPTDAPLDGGTLVVALADGGAEVLVVEGGALSLSRALPMREFSIDALATEISRTVLSWTARGGDRQIKRVLVAGEGEPAEKVVAGLRERLGESVDRLVLNGAITRRADVTVGLDTAAAAGVCVGALRGRPAMPNVLRAPQAQKRYRLKKAHRIGILAGLVAGALFLWSRIELSDRRAELERLKAELKGVEPEALNVMQMRENVRLAGQWMDDRYPWIDTFHALHEKIDPKKVWLTSCTVEENGTMRLQGRATDDEHVDMLNRQLQKVPAFQKVEREYTKPNQDKGGYRRDFAIRIQLAGLGAIKRNK